MIYITYNSNPFDTGTYIKNVWESKYNDLQKKYKSFLLDKSRELNIIINPYYYNMMNHNDYHSKLSVKEYKELKNTWHKFIRMWNFDKFISEKGEGIKLKYICDSFKIQ